MDLLGDELLAGAGLAGDEDRDVGAGDFFDRAQDLLHGRRGAGAGPDRGDRADAQLLQLGPEALVVALEVADQHHVAQDEAGLGGEHRQHLEVALAEQIAHAAGADIKGAQQPPALAQRHAHHARQAQRHHALRVLELGVAQGVTDDDRLLGAHDLGDDRVGQLLVGVGHRFLATVARQPDPRPAAVVEQHQEPLIGGAHLDDRIEQRPQQVVELIAVHEPLGELVQLAVGGQGRRIADALPQRRRRRARRRLDRRQLASDLGLFGELELGLAELEDVAARQLDPALLAPPDDYVAGDRDHRAQLALDLQVGVARLQLGIGDDDVIVGAAADGDELLEQPEQLGLGAGAGGRSRTRQESKGEHKDLRT